MSTEPDKVIEVFVSLIILLVGLAAVLEIRGFEVTGIVNSVIEAIIPIFIFVFLAAVFWNIANEILG